MKNCNYTEKRFREFIRRVPWIFAKTYAHTAPHEYTALRLTGEACREEFIRIAKFIRSKGFKAYYASRPGYYYVLDDYYYWTMDENVEDTDLINRAKCEEYELINHSWHWKGPKQ